MIRSFAIFFSLVGFFVLALALASAPQTGDVEASETKISADGCVLRQVALDEGYGVSRTVARRICDKP